MEPTLSLRSYVPGAGCENARDPKLTVLRQGYNRLGESFGSLETVETGWSKDKTIQ